jgi:citrate lyase subunit beta / citryl-CoA lyase
MDCLDLRSYLFVPGSSERLLAKVLDQGSDAVIVDLEDAVSPGEKASARRRVSEWLERHATTAASRILVRVNQQNGFVDEADVAAVCQTGLLGIVVPKAGTESGPRTDEVLCSAESRLGLDEGSFRILPLIESAKGVATVGAIAKSSTRIDRLTFGAIDLMADLGARGPVDGGALDYTQGRLVVASRVAGLSAPVDTVYPIIDDDEGLERAVRRSANFGFFGKLLIHPNQIDSVHRAYTPSADEVGWAERIVQAFDEAQGAGEAALVVDGRFVDLPVVTAARRVLAVATRLRSPERTGSRSARPIGPKDRPTTE